MLPVVKLAHKGLAPSRIYSYLAIAAHAGHTHCTSDHAWLRLRHDRCARRYRVIMRFLIPLRVTSNRAESFTREFETTANANASLFFIG